jgi:hypothetical protein
MSEYQYYEFQAIDRPLGADEREQLRAISSRARITATSFVNSYDFGNLKADPLKLLERYFDLFCYVANWGTRQFAMRVPKGLVDLGALKRFDLDEELALIRSAGEHVIFSINRDEIDAEEWDDGSGHLAGLAPLAGRPTRGRFSAVLPALANPAGGRPDSRRGHRTGARAYPALRPTGGAGRFPCCES